MYRTAAAIILALLSPLSLAANQATLTWTPPTTYADGSALLPGEVVTFNIYQGVKGQPKVKVQSAVSGGTATIASGLATGSEYCWQISSVSSISGKESGLSNEACKAFPLDQAPAAPTGLGAR